MISYPTSGLRARLVQFSRSVVSDSLQPHALQHARPPCPSATPRVLLKLMTTDLVTPSNHLILCRPLLLPSIFPSIRVFSSESALHIRWPKYWSFSFSISPSIEHSGLISFRMDLLDLLVSRAVRFTVARDPESTNTSIDRTVKTASARLHWNTTQPSNRMESCRV